MRRLVIAFGATVAVGCGAPSARPSAAGAITELASALQSDDVASVAAATGRSEADVLASQSFQGAELRALGETLARAPTETTAQVVLREGGAVVLVRDGESWRVDRGVLGRPALARPVDAVIAFHDALARARIDGVLGVLARAPRAELELELGRWLDGTADPDALQISVQGDSAVAVTPTGERLELVRESGEWRVVGF